MPLPIRCALILAPALFLAGLGAAHAGAPSVTQDDLLAALEDLEAGLSSYSVTCDLTVEERAVADPANVLRSKAVLEVLAEPGRRFRFRERGVLPRNGDTTGPERVVQGAFDGELLREVAGHPDRPGLGVVSAKAESAQWRTDPRIFLTHYFHRSIRQWLVERNGRVIGTEPLDGRPVLRVETEPLLVSDAEWKQAFWIDPALGFATVKRAAFVRHPPEGGWFEYTHILTSDYSEAAAGIWVPGRAVYESFRAVGEGPATPSSETEVTSRHEVRFRGWKINPPLADEDFRLVFPDGTFINDQVTGQSYVYNKLTESDIAGQVAEARRMPAPAAALSTRELLLWANAAVLGIAVVIAVVIRYARRRRVPPGQAAGHESAASAARPT